MTIYISEARLTRAGQRLARDPYAVHRTLTFALSRPRVAWARPAPDVLIVQCDTPLRPTTVPGLTDYIASTIKLVAYPAGARVEIAGIVNPTRDLRPPPPPDWTPGQPRGRSKRRALPPDQWAAWAERKLGPALHLDTIGVADHGLTHGRKAGHLITISLAAIRATGTVRDPAALAAILTDGAGDARSLGAGLILCQELT